MANLPTTILTHLRVQTTTTPQTSTEPLITEIVDCYIALYHWTAIANVTCQALLPSPDTFDEAISEHNNIKRMVDGSYNNFSIVAHALEQVHQDRIRASRINHLLREAQESWRLLVRNTEGALAPLSLEGVLIGLPLHMMACEIPNRDQNERVGRVCPT